MSALAIYMPHALRGISLAVWLLWAALLLFASFCFALAIFNRFVRDDDVWEAWRAEMLEKDESTRIKKTVPLIWDTSAKREFDTKQQSVILLS